MIDGALDPEAVEGKVKAGDGGAHDHGEDSDVVTGEEVVKDLVVGGAVEEVIEGAEEEHGAGAEEEEGKNQEVAGVDELKGKEGVEAEDDHEAEANQVRPDVHRFIVK